MPPTANFPGPSPGLGQFGDIHLPHLVGRAGVGARGQRAQEPLDVGWKCHRQLVLGRQAHRGVDEFGSEGRPHVVIEVGDVDPGGEGTLDLSPHFPFDCLGMAVLAQVAEPSATCSHLHRSAPTIGWWSRSAASGRPSTRR